MDDIKTPPSEPKSAPKPPLAPPATAEEFGGATGPEPTRFGDWERKGRVSDF